MIVGLALLLAAVVLSFPKHLAPFLSHLLFQNPHASFIATLVTILAPLVATCLVYSYNGVVYEDSITYWFLIAVLGSHLLLSRPPRHAIAKLLLALSLLSVAHQVTVCRPQQDVCHDSFNDRGPLGHVLAGGALALVTWALVGRDSAAHTQARATRVACAVLVVLTQVADQDLLHPLAIPRVLVVWAVRAHLGVLVYATVVAHWVSKRTAVVFAIAQFHRLAGLSGLVAVLVSLDAVQALEGPVEVTVAHLLVRFALFATGHQTTLSSIQWAVGHLGLWNTHLVLSPLAILANTVGHVALVVGHLRTWPGVAAVVAWEMVGLAQASMAAFVLRRHWVVWGVFAPRWMASVLVFVALVASVGVRWVVGRRP